MTPNVSLRSLLALGAGLGASAMLGETALAKAPKVGTQPAYFYRFGLGDAEVTVYREAIAPDGMVWVSWPKKASGVPTEVTEDTVRELALPLGLVDIKVCAVDEVWSGLKLVIRKEYRAR